MMCRRGGSKGGEAPGRNSARNTHQNTDRGNAGEPQTDEKQPGGRNTHRVFFSAKMGQI